MNPIETAVRARIRTFIEALIGEELDAVLARPRYGGARHPAMPAQPPARRRAFCLATARQSNDTESKIISSLKPTLNAAEACARSRHRRHGSAWSGCRCTGTDAGLAATTPTGFFGFFGSRTTASPSRS